MKLNKENGITIVALIITIILMIILAGTTVYFSTRVIDKANLEDIKTDMISIKTKAKIIAEQYNFKDIEALVGTVLDEDTETEGLQASNVPEQLMNLFEETTTNDQAETVAVMNISNLYIWEEENLEAQGLATIDGSKYIVYYNLENPNNCEVYYIDGYVKDDITYYSLTDLENI